MVGGFCELDRVVEYKFLIRDLSAPGRVKWDNGGNRSFAVTSDEIGIVLDEYPFRYGTSEWRNYDPDRELEELKGWGDYEQLKRRQSFWELWEHPPGQLATSRRAHNEETSLSSSSGHRCDRLCTMEHRKTVGERQQYNDEDSLDGRTTRDDQVWPTPPLVGGSSQPRPKPFWMFDRREIDLCDDASSRIQHILKERASTVDTMNINHNHTPLHSDSEAAFHHFDPSPIYRSGQLSYFLLCRDPSHARLSIPRGFTRP